MTLPASGQIAATDINTELAIANGAKTPTSTLSLNAADARALAAVPSGEIAYSDFYGKSAQPATASVSWSTGSIVSGNSASFTATFSRSTNYSWTVSGAGATPSSGNGGPATSFTQSISFPSPNTGTATVTVTPTGGSSSSASLTVSAQGPTVEFALLSGAGGGGGGGLSSDPLAGGGGGGGSAGFSEARAVLQYDRNYNVYVGLGGAGGAVGYAGTNGDATVIYGPISVVSGSPASGPPAGSYTQIFVWGGGAGGSGGGNADPSQQPFSTSGSGFPAPGGGSLASGGGGAGGGSRAPNYANEGGRGAVELSSLDGGYVGGNTGLPPPPPSPNMFGIGPTGGGGGGGYLGHGESTTDAVNGVVWFSGGSAAVYGGQGGRSIGQTGGGQGLLNNTWMINSANTPDSPRPDTQDSFTGGGGGGTGDASTNAPGGISFWNSGGEYFSNNTSTYMWQSASGTATDRNARDGYGHGGGGGAVGQAGGRGSNGAFRMKWSNFNSEGYFNFVSFSPNVPGTPNNVIIGPSLNFAFSQNIIIFYIPGTYTFRITSTPPIATVSSVSWNPTSVQQNQSSNLSFSFSSSTAYTWTISGAGATPSSGSGTAASGTATITFNSSGTATATVTPSGGVGVSASISVAAPPPPPPPMTQIRVFLVGGGGGGQEGDSNQTPGGGGGGGGAGGVTYALPQLIQGTQYTITVGRGGDVGMKGDGSSFTGGSSLLHAWGGAQGIPFVIPPPFNSGSYPGGSTGGGHGRGSGVSPVQTGSGSVGGLGGSGGNVLAPSPPGISYGGGGGGGGGALASQPDLPTNWRYNNGTTSTPAQRFVNGGPSTPTPGNTGWSWYVGYTQQTPSGVWQVSPGETRAGGQGGAGISLGDLGIITDHLWEGIAPPLEVQAGNRMALPSQWYFNYYTVFAAGGGGGGNDADASNEASYNGPGGWGWRNWNGDFSQSGGQSQRNAANGYGHGGGGTAGLRGQGRTIGAGRGGHGIAIITSPAPLYFTASGGGRRTADNYKEVYHIDTYYYVLTNGGSPWTLYGP